MASNLRNSRTSFPRKAARRQRAAARFYINAASVGDAGYIARKTQEAIALGLDPTACYRGKARPA